MSEINNFQNRSILLTDASPEGSTFPFQSGPGSNGNKEEIHTFHVFRTEDSLSDPVHCHPQDSPFYG